MAIFFTTFTYELINIEKMNTKNILLFSVALLISSSCSLLQTNVNSSTNNVSAENTEDINQKMPTLKDCTLDGMWFLESVDSTKVSQSINKPYIEFELTNLSIVKCYAYDGCNYINGEFKLYNNSALIKNAEFVSTLKDCDKTHYEAKMTTAINKIASYTISNIGENIILHLKDSSNNTIMVLKKTDTESIGGAWQVTVINGVSIDESHDLNIVLDLSGKSVHGNVGCNTMNGTIVYNHNLPNDIMFTNMITTRMLCPDMTTETDLLKALEAVRKINLNESGSIASLLDHNGSIVVSLKRLTIE